MLSGYLSTNEVLTALQTLGFLVNHQELRKTMRNLRMSKEEGSQKVENFMGYLTVGITIVLQARRVSFSDFLQIVMEHQGDSRDTYEEIKLGFRLFDCDGDGKITFDNLKDACKSAGVYFSHQNLQDLSKEVDMNGDEK
ncbi:centrin-1-like [Stegostoma tigrinum]|uniref:centrin-1-like n=1 Tax=Stegostoma tigrinum TaxID=3053191 RepID=UPI00286FF855|nr:centrin-1-like [Stegostoma tigrinum]